MTTRTTPISESEAKAQLHAIAIINSAVSEYHKVLRNQGFDAQEFTSPIFESYKEATNFVGQNMEPKRDHLRYNFQAQVEETA